MRKRHGFSLIEMLVCVTILGILSGGIALTANKMTAVYDKYADTVVLHDLLALTQGAEVFKRLYGAYPNSASELLESGVCVGDTRTQTGEMAIERDKEGRLIAGVKLEADGSFKTLGDYIDAGVRR